MKIDGKITVELNGGLIKKDGIYAEYEFASEHETTIEDLEKINEAIIGLAKLGIFTLEIVKGK